MANIQGFTPTINCWQLQLDVNTFTLFTCHGLAIINITLATLIFSLHTCSGFQTISTLCILTIISPLPIQWYKVKGNFNSFHMHHFIIPNFSKCTQALNEIKRCANVHGHIHTHCTLALFSDYYISC
jgi:hypothetical protein